MDLRWFSNFRRKARERKVPRNAFSSFASNREMFVSNLLASTSDWVSARFSTEVDELLCLGGNDGSVGLYNVSGSLADDNHVDVNKGMISCVRAHNGAVMGVYGVPGKPNEILSIGGDGSAKIWDMSSGGKLLSCFGGHITIIRSASFAPASSDVFVTCGRDGKFCLNDRRCQSKRDRNGVEYIPPSRFVEDAHLYADSGRQYQGIKDPPGITNIIHLDDYTVVTASDKSITGVRFWDTRRLDSRPVRSLKVPQHRSCRQAGIASMTVDRFSSHLYVAVTDHTIYEYALQSDCNTSQRSLLGARTNFDVTLSVSPVSDHLICGSTNSCCLLYDLQDSHRYLDDFTGKGLNYSQVRPSYTFEGHDSDVSAVSWSCNGSYIVTVDNTKFRIWAANREMDSDEQLIRKKENLPGFQRVSFRPSTPRKISTESTTASLRRMSVSEGSACSSKPALVSSPSPKRLRITTDSSPLRNLTNSPSNTLRQAKDRHWDRPTADLPLRAVEFQQKYREESQPKAPVISMPKRNLNDFWDSQKKQNLEKQEPQKTSVLDSGLESKLSSQIEIVRKNNTLHRYFCQR